MLTPNNLREIDETLLDLLSEGRVTPIYCKKRIEANGAWESITRGYVQERLARLHEHGHVTNLLETGLYELESDPREAHE